MESIFLIIFVGLIFLVIFLRQILNSYLIGFSCESPEYLEMMDAYMKGTFFDFFYTKEFVYWIKKEDPEEPYFEKDAIYFKRQGKYDIVTSDYFKYPKVELLKP